MSSPRRSQRKSWDRRSGVRSMNSRRLAAAKADVGPRTGAEVGSGGGAGCSVPSPTPVSSPDTGSPYTASRYTGNSHGQRISPASSGGPEARQGDAPAKSPCNPLAGRPKTRRARFRRGKDLRSLPICFRTRDNRATDRNDCCWPGFTAGTRGCGARRACASRAVSPEEGDGRMAAMKPRTGDGPLEVTKEGRGIVMRVPLEGGGRLVVELTPDEAARLGDALKSVVG
jgi:hypothetical protein